MKLISARQAWREAMHESRDSVMAAAAERAKLGKRGYVVNETRPDRWETNGRCAHMLAAGLVQQAIDTLPKTLQHLGHFLYSPIVNGNDLSIAHSAAWFGSGVVIPAARQQRGYWLTLCALQSHKHLVTGREAMGPAWACAFVEDRLGERMNPDNWTRDWSAVWDALASQIDRMDKQALKPVADVVNRMNGRTEADVA